MRTYPVVNLAPANRAFQRMGQVRGFEVLSDQVLARLCGAVEDYNNADTGWGSPDADAGDRTQRDSTAAIQSVIDGVSPELKNAAIWEIRKYCPDADALLDTVRKPGPETPPAIPPSKKMVPSVDRYIPRDPPHPTPTPPPERRQPPPPLPKGSVASQDRYYPRVPRPPVVETGSEGGPTIPTFEGPLPPPPQPPPPPPYVPQPPVATSSTGCWYVMGQGYMWGERPSGGESTGLNEKDCEALRIRDLEVRTGQPQLTQQAYCDTSKGEFPDGRGGCRRSVSSFPGAPFGLPGGSGGVSAPSLTGRRRGGHGNGNLEWWSYQQAFLPQLFFAKRRISYPTLGADASVGQVPAKVVGTGSDLMPVLGIAAVGALVYAVVEGLL